ncbi:MULTISPECIES: ABC transporter permease [unclassified Pseudodesulfovibrio]|uniref:ABC transporter permease n=1 Tax=unclassified Pseudodesulfovibrio TaxID=2661612 RepID=UPI001F50296C|nr:MULTISPECIES: ABC transporter permease [unclassified Pseudodesulfovibrio]MCJ2164771.1 ABC transporter permease [Pseudodesulfovibrio sp. S3-i]
MTGHSATLPMHMGTLLDKLRLGDARHRAVWVLGFCIVYFATLTLAALWMSDSGLGTDFLHRKLAPCLEYPFGTDWLGRDMLVRTVKGLCRSLSIGLLAATISSLVSVILGLAAATLGPKTDAVVSAIIDLVMATPHLVLLILVSFACGGGATGVIIAVAVSHWPRLARIIRAEVLQLRSAEFIHVAKKMGKTPWWIARRHMLPHIFPQFVIGLILLFPHAILHAAGLTFLGFGLSPHNPSIGILLAESMRHLSTGYWWLAILPGLSLVVTVKLFDVLGNNLRIITDPRTSQE